jgi:predicted RNA-binding Zn-ribbon protein involved in translation (DUF1610 family)
MTRIRTRCPSCGEVELGADEVALHLRADDPDSAFYDFVCPSCTTRVRKPADDHVAQMLIGGGVDVVLDRAHPEDPGDGPILTTDDLLDLILALRSDDFLDELVDSTDAAVS